MLRQAQRLHCAYWNWTPRQRLRAELMKKLMLMQEERYKDQNDQWLEFQALVNQAFASGCAVRRTAVRSRVLPSCCGQSVAIVQPSGT
jgi:hypothetical protein